MTRPVTQPEETTIISLSARLSLFLAVLLLLSYFVLNEIGAFQYLVAVRLGLFVCLAASLGLLAAMIAAAWRQAISLHRDAGNYHAMVRYAGTLDD